MYIPAYRYNIEINLWNKILFVSLAYEYMCFYTSILYMEYNEYYMNKNEDLKCFEYLLLLLFLFAPKWKRFQYEEGWM